MPKIPTLTQNVQEQATPRVAFSTGASPAAFGGGQAADLAALGAGLAQAGRATTTVAGEWQRQEEDADLNGAVAEFRDEARSILQGKDGILLREGRDAVGATGDATARLQQLKQKYGQRFISPRARDSWEEWSSRAVGSYMDSVSRHEAIEGRRWQDTAAQARIMSAVNELVEHRDNPADALDYEAEIGALVEQRYGSMGPDVVAQQKAAALNLAHSGAIDAFREAGQFADADEWLTLYGDRLNATYRAKAEGAVKQRVKEDELLAVALQLEDSGASLADQIEWIDKNVTDAKAHDVLVSRVREQDADKTAEAVRKTKVEGEAVVKEAIKEFRAGNFDYEAPEPDKVNSDHLKEIEVLRQQWRERVRKGQYAEQSDPTVLAQALELARTDPETFHDLPIVLWRGQLEEKDYDALIKMQNEGTTTPAQWEHRVLVIGERALNDAGIKATKGNKVKRGAYFSRLKEEMIGLQIDDYTGARKLAKDLLMEGIQEGRVWDSSVRRFEVPPEEFTPPGEAVAPTPYQPMPMQGTMGGGYVPPAKATPAPAAPAPSAPTVPAVPEEPRPSFIPPGYTRNPKTGNYERVEGGRVVRILSPVDGRRIK